jgi:hypothetical protein
MPYMTFSLTDPFSFQQRIAELEAQLKVQN